MQLAKEAKTDDERKAQAYGVEEPNPSVISLNAISAAHAANDFLLDYLCLRPEACQLHYEHFHFLKQFGLWSNPGLTRNVRSVLMAACGLRVGIWWNCLVSKGNFALEALMTPWRRNKA